MAEITLRARKGRQPGSRESRRIRRAGMVPAIVYGRELDPIPVTVDHHDVYVALHTEAGLNVLINLEIEGDEPVLTMAREVDRHPFRDQIRHIDFVKVSLTETVTAEVAIHPVGESAGVKEGGILSLVRNQVEIEALPTAIPPAIELDVSSLEIGDALRVEDLPVIEGVTYVDDPDAVVVTVTAPAVAEVVEEVEEELEGEEGAEAAEGEEAQAEGESAE